MRRAVDAGLLLVFALGWTLASGPPSLFAAYENTLLRWLLLLIPWAMYLGRADLIGLIGTANGRQTGLLMGIVALGAALRFWLPSLPFHANNWMEDLVGRVATEPEPAWYANGYGIFMRLFTLLGLRPEQAIFTGNRVAGLLMPLAIYGAARALLSDVPLALCAALLAACLPVHVRLSASESMQIIPMLFVFISIVGFCGHARSGSRALLVLGVAAFSWAVLTRLDVSVVALALPLLYAPRLAWRSARDPWLIAAVGAALILGGPLAVAGIRNHDESLTSPAHAARIFIESIRFAGPPHVALTSIAVLGFVLCLWQGRSWGVLFVLMAFAATVEVSAWDANRANRLQLLCAQFPWLLFGAAAVPATILRLTRGVASQLAQVGIGALVAWGTFHASIFRVVWDQHQEWVFLHEKTPAAEVLIRPGRSDRRDAEPLRMPALASYLVDSKTQIWDVSDLLAGNVALPATYYRALNCYQNHSRPGAPAELEPWCAAVESRYRLTPIQTTQIDAAPYWATAPSPPVEIGFFRLEERQQLPH